MDAKQTTENPQEVLKEKLTNEIREVDPHISKDGLEHVIIWLTKKKEKAKLVNDQRRKVSKLKQIKEERMKLDEAEKTLTATSQHSGDLE